MGRSVARETEMIDIRIEGMEELRRDLQDFSDRRLKAAVATGLTRTGGQVKDKVTQTMRQVLDRPTPYTMRALFLDPAKADTLQARVWFKDDLAGSGTPATKYLLPQVDGGKRSQKRFEKSLQYVGVLRAPYSFVTPGPGASIDAYGNWNRGQIIQILSQLRVTLTAGFSRNLGVGAKGIAAQRRAGGRFFAVVQPTASLKPGIYQREFTGNNITPVAFFVRRADYRKRLDFYGVAGQVVQARLQDEVARAIGESAARMTQARGGQA